MRCNLFIDFHKSIAALDLGCETGVYEVTIVLDSVSPMSFLLN